MAGGRDGRDGLKLRRSKSHPHSPGKKGRNGPYLSLSYKVHIQAESPVKEETPPSPDQRSACTGTDA